MNSTFGETVSYKAGYKYQTVEQVSFFTGITHSEDIKTDYILFKQDGTLIFDKGYAWDGPSGPAVDTPKFIWASLPHDGGYQMIRMQLLSPSFRAPFDHFMKQLMQYDLAQSSFLVNRWNRVRAQYAYWAVRRFAMSAADPKNAKKVLRAPR